jgi:heme/copper-type cytochrome/quinol oxidase subunit 2
VRSPDLVSYERGRGVSSIWLIAPALIVLAIGVLTPTHALFPDQGDVSLYLE